MKNFQIFLKILRKRPPKNHIFQEKVITNYQKFDFNKNFSKNIYKLFKIFKIENNF